MKKNSFDLFICATNFIKSEVIEKPLNFSILDGSFKNVVSFRVL
jgi:hypothetical protein